MLVNSTDIVDFVPAKMVRIDDLLRLFLDYEGNEELSLQKVCLTKGLTENKNCLFSRMTVTKTSYCLMAACLNNETMNNLIVNKQTSTLSPHNEQTSILSPSKKSRAEEAED